MLKCLNDLNLKGKIKAKTDLISRLRKEKKGIFNVRLLSNLTKI